MTTNHTINFSNLKEFVFSIRNQPVFLDTHLAQLYEVETRALLQAIKRNKERFPKDFMFQLNNKEFDFLRSQFVISKGKGGRRYLPYAFTEQGIAMLSSVLKSEKAIYINIQIMRAFVKLRQLAHEHHDLHKKLKKLEESYDKKFKVIFQAIHQLMLPPEPSKKRSIGFHPWKE